MRKLMNAVMLSCRRATEQIEKRRHLSLQAKEKIQLRTHLFFCKYCRRYARQTALIDRLLSPAEPALPAITDTVELEERIIQEVQKR